MSHPHAIAVRRRIGQTRPSVVVARIIAVAAVAIVIVCSLPCWGGPGLSENTLGGLITSTAVLSLLLAGLVFLAPVAVPAVPRAGRLIGVSILLYGVASLWLGLRIRASLPVPVPYWTDGIWMLFYAALVSGVVLAIRPGEAGVSFGTVVDGLLAGLAAMTLAAATIFNGLIGGVDHGLLRSVTALSYPIWDLTLLGVVAAGFGVSGLLHQRRWTMLALAVILLATADVAYLKDAASGNFSFTAWYRPIYFGAALALVCSTWCSDTGVRRASVRNRWHLVAPAVVVVIAGGVLLWDHYDRRNTAAVVLATLALVAVAVRSILTILELRHSAEVRRLAMTDELTGLPNRYRFSTALRLALDGDHGVDGGIALLVLDLDRFKELNDTLGHDVGDRLLTEIGARLRASLPSGNLVARLGGDEFAILVTGDGPTLAVAKNTAAQVRAALDRPVQLGGMSLPVDASVGIAMAPAHGADAETLLRRADVAMYHAKTSQSGCEIYTPERDKFSIERLSLGAELRDALERGELRVLFQPIVDVRTVRLLRAEALVRWEHPTRGLLGPAEFLAVAEHTGSMRALTTTVLRIAVAQSAAWQRGGTPLGVAVNLSASDLLDADFPDSVGRLLAVSAIEPSMLHFELTEHRVLEDTPRALETLRALRDIGVGLSLDDFGTGYSSLAYLRGLPVDELKIDRSFVAGITTDPDDAAIVRSTITLGHELGLRVIAEGIETAEAARLVADWGADALQGFHIGMPTSGESIAAQSGSYAAPREAARHRSAGPASRTGG